VKNLNSAFFCDDPEDFLNQPVMLVDNSSLLPQVKIVQNKELCELGLINYPKENP